MRPSQGHVSKGWFSSLLSLAGDTRGRKDQEAALREPLSSRTLEAGTFSLRAFPVLTTLCLSTPWPAFQGPHRQMVPARVTTALTGLQV